MPGMMIGTVTVGPFSNAPLLPEESYNPDGSINRDGYMGPIQYTTPYLPLPDSPGGPNSAAAVYGDIQNRSAVLQAWANIGNAVGVGTGATLAVGPAILSAGATQMAINATQVVSVVVQDVYIEAMVFAGTPFAQQWIQHTMDFLDQATPGPPSVFNTRGAGAWGWIASNFDDAMDGYNQLYRTMSPKESPPKP
jgi:hypothetical protein